jgi:nucleoside-diphosphate-sugar epimerase
LSILLTGGGGSIGSHTAEVIANAGYGVAPFNNFNKVFLLILIRLSIKDSDGANFE